MLVGTYSKNGLKSFVDSGFDRHIKTRKAIEAFHKAPGQNLSTTQMTVWGLLNAVTYTIDHHLGNNPDSRLRQAWFGSYAKVKKRAFELAQDLL